VSGRQLVWFKRDLRVADHAPLVEATKRGPVLCLYVFEPSLCTSEEFDGSHLEFIRQSLADLRDQLRQRDGELLIRIGEVPEVLEAIHQTHPIARLWSHEETGNRLTYERDKRVGRWARDRGVPWTERPQNGVVRPLRDRDGWSRRWQRRMNPPPLEAPPRVPAAADLDPGPIPDAADLGVEPSRKPGAWPGGESHARETLRSFLEERGTHYRKQMSSPLEGELACSRISAHLAWGNLSIRQAHHAARERAARLRAMKEEGLEVDAGWLPSLKSFQGRLRWHCHFMQKLEDEPEIEFRNINRAFDGLREGEFREDRFEAWCRGETGYPMVDACMRALHHGGWINFRMRAMLVSFAANHLWLHWRRPAVFLARHFLDFEPGIHFSQFQMQSGVTGINTIRIYSPAKQVLDQDPDGIFLRRFLPELEGVPKAYLAEPHRMDASIQKRVGCVIGRDYPAPIVDHKSAYHEARRRIGEIRKRPETRAASDAVQRKHGSRKRPSRRWR